MRLTYLVLHVQCGCNTVLVYLPKFAAPPRADGCCLFSSRDAGSVDDVVGLQVVGTLRYGKSPRQLQEILTVDLFPSECATCKGIATITRPSPVQL